MKRQRFPVDTATGSSDLAWNLVMLFFITTLIAVRPVAGVVSEVRAEDRSGSEPVVVELPEALLPAVSEDAFALEGLEVIRRGPLAPRGAAQPLARWLEEGCARSDPAPTVQLVCPPNATHRQCQRVMGALLLSAPECAFQY